MGKAARREGMQTGDAASQPYAFPPSCLPLIPSLLPVLPILPIFSIDTTSGPKYAQPKHFHVLRGTSATVPDGGPP